MLAHSIGDNKAAVEYYMAALQYDSDNVEIMQHAFTLLVAEGRLDDAMPMASRLIALDSDSPLPMLVLGVKDARDGHWPEAAAQFTTMPKRGINTFLGPLLGAWALAGEGRTDDALTALAPLAQSHGLKALHAFHAGLINDLADRAGPAEDDYKVALADQLNIRTVEAMGSLYQRTGRAAAAKALYDSYHAEHPDTLLFDGDRLLKAGAAAPRAIQDARGGLAEALFDVTQLMRQGDAAEFAMVFGRLALALQPNFPLAQMTVADILSGANRSADANAIYKTIDPASPVYTFGQLRMAVNLDAMGDTDGALADLGRLAQDHPESVDALITKGDILRSHKKYAEAAEAYSAAVTRLPDDRPEAWALYYSRGITFERSKQWPKAEADFLKALKLKPDQPDVLNYLGYSWIDRGINLDAGRAMIEKAVTLRPTDGAIVDSLGWALYRLGKYDDAVKVLERAVQLKGDDSTINEHLGDAYWRDGRGRRGPVAMEAGPGRRPRARADRGAEGEGPHRFDAGAVRWPHSNLILRHLRGPGQGQPVPPRRRPAARRLPPARQPDRLRRGGRHPAGGGGRPPEPDRRRPHRRPVAGGRGEHR